MTASDVFEPGCPHSDQVRVVEPNSDGCRRCLEIGDTWVHLRMCLMCGEVGCCDSSKNKHARKHAGESGHPIARSREPGEDWWWCFIDDDFVGAGPVEGE